MFDYVFLVRPTLMYPIWIYFLCGFWSGQRWPVVAHVTTLHAVMIGTGLTLVMAAVSIFNQIRDAETDRINRKLFLICDGHVPVRTAYIEALICGLLGVAIGWMAELRAGVMLAFALFMAGYLYSFPPARMKDRPIGGLLVNGFGGLIVFILGWISAGGAGWFPLRSLTYFGGFSAVMLNTTMPDMKGDRETGKITFPVKYGVRPTVIWALIVEVITVCAAFYFHEWILFFPGLAMVPFFIYALTKKHVADVIRATKYSVFAMAIAICWVFPWFLIPMWLIFFGSRWYYRKRFGFDYPNLKSG